MTGRVTELDHDNLAYTIRRESGVTEKVEEHHVIAAQATY